jgi:hypothetical protein
MLGLLVIEWLHMSITWNTFEKLQKVLARFNELANDSKNQQGFICAFFQKVFTRLNEILQRVEPKIARFPKSTSEKQRLIKENVQVRRDYVELLR